MKRERLSFLADNYTAGEIAHMTGIPEGRVRAEIKRHGLRLRVGLRHGYKKRKEWSE